MTPGMTPGLNPGLAINLIGWLNPEQPAPVNDLHAARLLRSEGARWGISPRSPRPISRRAVGYAIFQTERGDVRTTTNIEGLVVHKPGSYFVDTAQITLRGMAWGESDRRNGTARHVRGADL